MAGTYQLLKNGKARLQYMLNRERYSQTVEAKNDTEAKTALALFVSEIKRGNYVTTDYTYTQFAQRWLDDYVRVNCSESYLQSCINYLNNRILPFFGNYKLEEISTKLLRQFCDEMKTWKTNYDPPRENVPISRETYTRIYKIVSASLQKAFEWEVLKFNPCRRVTLKSLHLEKLPSEIIKLQNKKSKSLKFRAYSSETFEKVLRLLDNRNPDLFNDIYRMRKIAVEVSLQTGFCLEELAGLKWDRDYSFKDSTLTVNTVRIYIKHKGWIEKEPKVESRHRIITIPQYLNKILYKARQKYKDQVYIFSGLINFNSFTSWLKKWQKENDIFPILSTHELRHSHATYLLKRGVNIKHISCRLGHSSVRTTEDIYMEYLPEDDKNIADLLEICNLP